MAGTAVLAVQILTKSLLSSEYAEFLDRLKDWHLAINEEGEFIDLDEKLFVRKNKIKSLLYHDFDSVHSREHVAFFVDKITQAAINIIAEPKFAGKLIFMSRPKKYMS